MTFSFKNVFFAKDCFHIIPNIKETQHNNTKVLSTCSHLVRSTTEPGEDCWRSLVPVEQLRNRDDRHFRAVHHSLNLMDKPIMCTWLQGDMLKYLMFISNILLQRARVQTYQSMTHEMHKGFSSCCLSLPEEKGLVAEDGWLNSLSECPGSHQQWISSRETPHDT